MFSHQPPPGSHGAKPPTHPTIRQSRDAWKSTRYGKMTTSVEGKSALHDNIRRDIRELIASRHTVRAWMRGQDEGLPPRIPEIPRERQRSLHSTARTLRGVVIGDHQNGFHALAEL
jgi:hypothetical protein